MRRRSQRTASIGLLALLWLLTSTSCAPAAPVISPDEVGSPPPAASERVRARRVIDGDSIVADGFDLRLIAVNAPERGDPLYEPARDFLAQMVTGRDLYLERDIEVLDQYGRDLAYAYLEDGRFVNLEMVLAGFAQTFTVPPNVRYVERFHEAEAAAREAGVGLWRPSPVALRIETIHFDAPGRDEENPGGEWVEIRNVGGREIQLAGMTLSDEANTSFTFPRRRLAAGDSLRLHSGRGRDGPRQLYWGVERAVWNNSGDAGILRDADGLFVDVYRYQGR